MPACARGEQIHDFPIWVVPKSWWPDSPDCPDLNKSAPCLLQAPCLVAFLRLARLEP
jgi:hypothetical protein